MRTTDPANPADSLASQRAAAAARQRRADAYLPARPADPDSSRRVPVLIGLLAMTIVIVLAVAVLGTGQHESVAVDGPPAVESSDTYRDPSTRRQPGRPDGWFDRSATTSSSPHGHSRVR